MSNKNKIYRPYKDYIEVLSDSMEHGNTCYFLEDENKEDTVYKVYTGANSVTLFKVDELDCIEDYCELSLNLFFKYCRWVDGSICGKTI